MYLLLSVNFVTCCTLVDLSTKTVGPKEDTGFTSAYNVEPITFKPNEAHDGKLPVCESYQLILVL